MSTPRCSASHCSGVSKHINDTCKANKWPVGHLVLICNPITGECCNCTCSCFAWGTKILIPDNKEKVIQDFVIGDKVLACGPGLKWEPKIVEFSDGTGANSRQPMMLHLVYGDKKQELIVTMDHLFLVPGGKLKRADKLIVDKDVLVAPDGSQVKIHSVEVGTYIGGLHHIATSVGKPKSLDGHLIASQGVVSADYAVQVHYQNGELDNDEFLVPNHEALPQADDQQGNLVKPKKAVRKMAVANVEQVDKPTFIPKSALKVNIPDHAKRYFSNLQAKELGKNAPLSPVGYQPNQQAVDYLFNIFRAFYPEIHFLTDFYSKDFNAYSWKEQGKMFVVVSGGLTRVESLELAGLALIIAHEVGHLLGAEDENGLACEGEADYYGVANALRKVFYQDLFILIYKDSLQQIENTFNYIKQNRGKDRSCDNLSLDCRLKTYKAAGALYNLPVCAGGPALLALESATNTKSGVVLSFNEDLNAATAQTAQNYTIEGSTGGAKNPVVEKATFSPENPKEVVLTVTGLVPGTEYTVKVSNLYSTESSPLDPEHSSASFKA